MTGREAKGVELDAGSGVQLVVGTCENQMFAASLV